MLESLSPPFLPSLLPSLPALIRDTLTALSDRKTSVQNALADVPPLPQTQLIQAINERRVLRATSRQRKFAQVSLENATSYDDWAASALELDTLEGRNAWKDDPTSSEYDAHLLQKRLQQFRDARAAGDLTRLLFLLRVSLSRTFAHAGNPEVPPPGGGVNGSCTCTRILGRRGLSRSISLKCRRRYIFS